MKKYQEDSNLRFGAVWSNLEKLCLSQNEIAMWN